MNVRPRRSRIVWGCTRSRDQLRWWNTCGSPLRIRIRIRAHACIILVTNAEGLSSRIWVTGLMRTDRGLTARKRPNDPLPLCLLSRSFRHPSKVLARDRLIERIEPSYSLSPFNFAQPRADSKRSGPSFPFPFSCSLPFSFRQKFPRMQANRKQRDETFFSPSAKWKKRGNGCRN